MATRSDGSDSPHTIVIAPKSAEGGALVDAASLDLHPVLVATGPAALRRVAEFFAVTIRNRNTRAAYQRAVLEFLDFAQRHGVRELAHVTPMHVAAYIEQHPGAAPTRKQHLAALRMLFDWLVVGQVVPSSPASSVRGPSFTYDRGKTPVLTEREMGQLFRAIATRTPVGLRDRALIAVMAYGFGRVSAVVAMRGEDYYREKDTAWFRFHEKGGKRNEVPAHSVAQLYVNEYLAVAGSEKRSPLFRTWARAEKRFTERALSRAEAFQLVKRHARRADLSPAISCHSFRATGITAFLQGGGSLELAQRLAGHASPRTTKLYDRTPDTVEASEIERIHYW